MKYLWETQAAYPREVEGSYAKYMLSANPRV